MKEIVGLNKTNKWYIVKTLFKVMYYTVIKNENLLTYRDALRQVNALIAGATGPSQELVRKVVDDMPYEPFGVPGLTDTTQFHGNLAQQYEYNTLVLNTPGTYMFNGTVTGSSAPVTVNIGGKDEQ